MPAKSSTLVTEADAGAGTPRDADGNEIEPVSYVAHPWIVPDRIEARRFQVNLAVAASSRPSLVVLPTGLGKTVVALLVAADRLRAGAEQGRTDKVLILAPTKPLVEQHQRFFMEHLRFPDGTAPEDAVVSFSGDTAPDKRGDIWDAARVIIATPQVIENDLIARRYTLKDAGLIIYDEAHRATGDYPYVYIAERYLHSRPKGHRIGLTGSPGSDAERILEVCRNVDLQQMEIRTEQDEDVRPYVHDLKLEWEKVPLPAPLREVAQQLQGAIGTRVRALKAIGLLKGASSQPTRREILALAGEIQSRIRMADDPDRSLFDAMTLQAQALKIHHALELVETQGAPGFLSYWERLQAEGNTSGSSKATQAILADNDLQAAVARAIESANDDPKTEKVVDAVRVELAVSDDPRVIVFTNYRETCERIRERLSSIPNCKPVRFVGQASRDGDKGLTQKEQKSLLQEFRDGTHNVLVATSVAEEGLDIPQTDLVIFYEPVPSEIRAIQRRGRTARHREGRVVVLMYSGTRDEAYHWAAGRREKNMRRELRALQSTVTRALGATKQHALTGFENEPSATHPQPDPPAAPKQRPGPKPATAPEPVGTPAQAPPEAPAAAATGLTQEVDGLSEIAKGPLLREHAKVGQRVIEYFGTPTGQDGKIRMLVDHRENRSRVAKELGKRGVEIDSAQLQVADYALSDRVGIERKTTEDFLSSLLDGRLFAQARQLTTYLRPILIVEGTDLVTARNIPRSSIYGALASLATDFGISVLQTTNESETADLLISIARREQTESRRQAPVRMDKVAMNDSDRRRFIVEGLPNVSAVLARRLLARFGTVEAVMTASEEDLASTDGIGRKTAREIRRLLSQGDPKNT